MTENPLSTSDKAANHRSAIKAMDICFGIYLIGLTACSLLGTILGEVPKESTLWIFSFVAFNLVFSQFSTRLKFVKSEYVRFLINSLFCPWLVFAVKGPMAPFWPAHLILSLATILFFNLVNFNRLLAIVSIIFWPVNLIIATLIFIDHPDVYQMATEAGAILMNSAFIQLVMNLLNRSIEQENIKSKKLEIEIERREKMQHKAELVHKVDRYLAITPKDKMSLAEIIELVCKHLKWAYGAYWRVEDNILKFECSWFLDLPEIRIFESICREINFEAGIGLPGRVWKEKKAHWIVDVTKDSNFPRAPKAVQAGLHGAFSFPIRMENEVIGVIEFFSTKLETPDELFLLDCKGIGVRIGEVLYRTKLEKEIADQKAHLVNTSKMVALGEMAGGMAHEINTPLATIKMRTKQLGRIISQPQIDVENARKMAKVIESTADQIGAIIQGLRSFSRNSSNDPMIGEFIATIINEATNLCAQKIANRGITLQIDDVPKFQIKCRAAQILQVLVNLLNNASDAAESMREKWIKVSFVDNDEILTIRITDSGSGIPTEIEKNLFDPFFTTKEFGKGTGLGLSIAKGIMDDHQGHLGLDRSSQNTCFALQLPKFKG